MLIGGKYIQRPPKITSQGKAIEVHRDLSQSIELLKFRKAQERKKAQQELNSTTKEKAEI